MGAPSVLLQSSVYGELTRTAIVTGGVLVGARIQDGTKSARWLQRPDPRGKLVEVEGRRIYARVRGSGSPTVIICPDLLSPAASWWPVQDRPARASTVLTYDRSQVIRRRPVGSERLDLLQNAVLERG